MLEPGIRTSEEVSACVALSVAAEAEISVVGSGVVRGRGRSLAGGCHGCKVDVLTAVQYGVGETVGGGGVVASYVEFVFVHECCGGARRSQPGVGARLCNTRPNFGRETKRMCRDEHDTTRCGWTCRDKHNLPICRRLEDEIAG